MIVVHTVAAVIIALTENMSMSELVLNVSSVVPLPMAADATIAPRKIIIGMVMATISVYGVVPTRREVGATTALHKGMKNR